MSQRLRALEGHKEMRLIALTGYGQESDRHRSLESGFDSHLVKPVGTASLASALSAKSKAPETLQ
jgi:CheY-like chemotaxis protein